METILKINILFILTIILSGCIHNLNETTSATRKISSMDKNRCTKEGGSWNNQEDLYDDGSFEIYFYCSCPKKESQEKIIIFEGDTRSCK